MALASRPARTVSLLQIDVERILALLEEKTGVKLPRRLVGVSLADGVLHLRFAQPQAREATVEPLPLETPVFLFHDEETGEPTALEILDLDQLLEELRQPPRRRQTPPPREG